MRIIIKRGNSQRKLEHGYQLDEKVCHVAVNECWETKRKDTGCAGCREDEPNGFKHVITIKDFEKKIHPCAKGLDPCYTGGYYEVEDRDLVELGTCNNC